MEISRLIEGRASSNVISSTVDAPVREAIALLASKRIGAVPIMEGGRIVGIFSERDVLDRVANLFASVRRDPIATVMTRSPSTIYESETVAKALGLMAIGGFRHVVSMIYIGILKMRGCVSLGCACGCLAWLRLLLV